MLSVYFVVLVGSEDFLLHAGRKVNCRRVVVISFDGQPIHLAGHVADFIQLL